MRWLAPKPVNKSKIIFKRFPALLVGRKYRIFVAYEIGYEVFTLVLMLRTLIETALGAFLTAVITIIIYYY